MTGGVGSVVYEREALGFRDHGVLVEFRKYRVHDIEWGERGPESVYLRLGNAVSKRGIAILDGFNPGRFSRRCWRECHPLMDEDTGSMRLVLAYDELPKPESCRDLWVRRMAGTGARETVNHFLDGWHDGAVDHDLGGVHGWKAAFGAYYGDVPVAMLVLGRHPDPRQDTPGTLCITRLACHPNRPTNTSSWLIARARSWAVENGYDQLVSYAGVGGNYGTSYAAAGFEQAGEPVVVDPTDSTRENGAEPWLKRKWVCAL